MLSATSTYTTKSDVTYPPSLDSFHISHSKCWGMDVHKVRQDPIAFSPTQIPFRIHMARHASSVFRVRQCPFNTYHTVTAFLVTLLCTHVVLLAASILSGTRLGTLVLQTDHSFYISHSEGLFNLTANVCCILPHVRSPLCDLHFYVKLANRKQ